MSYDLVDIMRESALIDTTTACGNALYNALVKAGVYLRQAPDGRLAPLDVLCLGDIVKWESFRVDCDYRVVVWINE